MGLISLGILIKINATAKMSMSGMRNQPPRRFTTIECVGTRKPDFRKLIRQPRQKDCKITGFKHRGNRYPYQLVSADAMKVSGDANFATGAYGDYSGTLPVAGNRNGHPMTTDKNFAGKRIDSSNYTPSKAW